MTRAAVPSCALTDAELTRQVERQRRLAPDVERAVRDGAALEVQFRPGFDRGALDEMIAIERECCPFFTFAFDEGERTLTIGVEEVKMAPALDALGYQLGVGGG